MNTDVIVPQQRNVETKAVLDPGSEINMIDYATALRWRCHVVPTAKIQMTSFTSSHRSQMQYETFEVTLSIKDSGGRRRTITKQFCAVDRTGMEPLILGMPWLQAEEVIMDLGHQEWRFGYTSAKHRTEKPKKFLRWAKAAACTIGSVVILPGSKPVVGLKSAAATMAGSRPTDGPQLPRPIGDFDDVFDPSAPRSLRDGAEHAIETTEDPPFGPIYTLSVRELEELRRYIEEALANGWIRHSTSPAGAPILFVPKKDGGLRLCVDYRGLNQVTIKNRHPLPLISEILDRVQKAKRFSKVDLKDAFHGMKIKESDVWKTAFRTKYGHFEYLVMPFGLTNAPASFQAYMNKALAGLVDVTCVVYIDDILIFSEKPEDHWVHVRAVLERLRLFGLCAKLEKCVFDVTEIPFLGHILTTEGIKMDPSRVSTIADWQAPSSFHDTQVFLGFTNYYRRFIPKYSRVSLPLTNLLKGSVRGKKSGPFNWGPEQQEAFEQLKASFQKAPLLRHFDESLPIRLESDASGFASAAIISQLHNQAWHPIAFWSKKFIEAEKNYQVHDQELLAIVLAVKHWRHYLEGCHHPFEIFTDHQNLQGFMKVKSLNGRQARWAIELAPYDFTIKHRPGSTNPADGPSRRPDYAVGELEKHLNDLLPTLQRKLGLQNVQVAPVTGTTQLAKDPQGGLQTVDWQEGPQAPSLFKKTRWTSPPNAAITTAEVMEDEETDPDGREARRVLNLQVTPRYLAKLAVAKASLPEGDSPDEVPLLELIGVAQRADPLTRQRSEGVPKGFTRRFDGTASPGAGNTASDGTPELDAGNAEQIPRTPVPISGLWSIGEDNLLYHRNRPYIPGDIALKHTLMEAFHDCPWDGGHFGASKTLAKLRASYYWESMDKDVHEYVRTCETCQKTKAKLHRPYGELQSLPRPERPFAEISMDYISGLPPCLYKGEVFNAILVIVDRYTKLATYIPASKEDTSETLAEHCIHHVFKRFGLPQGIVSDRGSVFTSEFWETVCRILGIKRRLSTAFHPQTDGQTERQNRTLRQYLVSYCHSNQTKWAYSLDSAEFAYNSAQNASLQRTPFEALMGYNPSMAFEDAGLRKEEPAGDSAKQATDRLARLRSDREEMGNRWEKAVAAQKRYYDKAHLPMKFKANDLVLLSTKNLKLDGPSKKLSRAFTGPFRVAEPVGAQAYRLYLPPGSRVHPVFNVSRLEPYRRRLDSGEPELPPPVLLDDHPEWEVEEVKGKRSRRKKLQYLVAWVGYPPEYDEWVPAESLENAQEAVQIFEKSQAQTRQARGRPRKGKRTR